MYRITFVKTTALPCLVKTTSYGIDTIRYIGKKLWQTLPNEINESQSLDIFKEKVKLMRNLDCSCRLCKKFVPSIGFV